MCTGTLARQRRMLANRQGRNERSGQEESAARVYMYTGTSTQPVSKLSVLERVAWPGRSMRRVCTAQELRAGGYSLSKGVIARRELYVLS